MNHLPQAPENNIRVISNLFENSRRYSQVKVHHRCGGKFATGVNDIGGKLPPVSTTPVANLPLVSTTPAANFATSSACAVDTAGKFATGVNVTGSKFANTRTISGCRQLKVNLKAKIYIYVKTLLLKGAQTKFLIFFSLKIFSICHRCR
jgi:hypothetical protein